MSPLPDGTRQVLLEIARRSVVEAVHSRAMQEAFEAGSTAESAGVFVSLHRKSQLRGCIGRIGEPQPLAESIAYCARAAALEDPRFRPVEPWELSEIEIELSVLSRLEEITPDRIEIGKHGLMVTLGGNRGVLLPQVAVRYRWSATRFLEETCAKAALERNAWRRPGVRVEAFTAEVFGDTGLLHEAGYPRRVAPRTSYSSST